jgi:hypothetical protein
MDNLEYLMPEVIDIAYTLLECPVLVVPCKIVLSHCPTPTSKLAVSRMTRRYAVAYIAFWLKKVNKKNKKKCRTIP